jgi:hypothetical protein
MALQRKKIQSARRIAALSRLPERHRASDGTRRSSTKPRLAAPVILLRKNADQILRKTWTEGVILSRH